MSTLAVIALVWLSIATVAAFVLVAVRTWER